MSTETLTTAVCDRCGNTHAGGVPRDMRGWGHAKFYTYEKLSGIYPHNESGDVCPKCIANLQQWWDAPKNFAAKELS